MKVGNMQIFKIVTAFEYGGYLSIGHGCENYEDIVLWAMYQNGTINTFQPKTKDECSEGHWGRFLGGKKICCGRYDKSINTTSVAYLGNADVEVYEHSPRWIEENIKDLFGEVKILWNRNDMQMMLKQEKIEAKKKVWLKHP